MHRSGKIKYMVFSIYNLRNIFNSYAKNNKKILYFILLYYIINNDSVFFIRVQFAKKHRPQSR